MTSDFLSSQDLDFALNDIHKTLQKIKFALRLVAKDLERLEDDVFAEKFVHAGDFVGAVALEVNLAMEELGVS